MNYKPDEKDWIAYMYGELDEQERAKFDQYLLDNPEAGLEMEKFHNLRNLLSQVGDKEIIAPPIMIGDQPFRAGSRGHTRFLNTPYIKTILSVAASLLLIILVGSLTGTNIRISDQQISLNFGAVNAELQTATLSSSLTEDEVQRMINASLEKNNLKVEATLEETSKKLDASIRKNLALNSGNIDKLVREASSASQQQIRQYVETIRAENMQQVKDYFQLTSTEQKQYIENLLVDFAKYLQQQRNDDLQLVQMRMNSLEQNTNLFRQETEQILASIITTVNNPVSEETRN
jgi:hypothetical protein